MKSLKGCHQGAYKKEFSTLSFVFYFPRRQTALSTVMMDRTTCERSSCPRYGLSILLLLAALSMRPRPAPNRSVMPAVRAAILDHLYCAISGTCG